VVINLTIDGRDIVNKHPHLSTLRPLDLESFSWMPQLKELEDLLECFIQWNALEEEQRESKYVNKSSSSILAQQRSVYGKIVKIAYTLTCLA